MRKGNYLADRVLPSIVSLFNLGVVSDLNSLPGLEYDKRLLLHGQQYIEIYKPLPSSYSIKNKTSISGLHDKGKATILEIEVLSYDKESGELLSMNRNAIFLRGTGGFSKSSRPYSYTKQPPIQNPAVKIPKERPFAVHEECTQPSQGMDVNLYMPGHQVAYQSLPMADAAYPETTMAISPAASLMGQPSDTMTAARKRSAPGGVLERTVEKRHNRMIKNRESAACSTTRKQAYNNELGNKVSRLEEENERRRGKKLKPSSPVAVKQEKIAAK